MAALSTQEVVAAGTTLSFAACAGGGDTFINDGNTFLYVKNGSGGALTVTIAAPATPHGMTITAQAVSVGAGSEKCIKPYPQQFTQPAAATTNITYSGVTSLTIAAVKFTPPA